MKNISAKRIWKNKYQLKRSEKNKDKLNRCEKNKHQQSLKVEQIYICRSVLILLCYA